MHERIYPLLEWFVSMLLEKNCEVRLIFDTKKCFLHGDTKMPKTHNLVWFLVGMKCDKFIPMLLVRSSLLQAAASQVTKWAQFKLPLCWPNMTQRGIAV